MLLACGRQIETPQRCGKSGERCSPMFFSQSLQNRVPRVQVLLPLPLKNRVSLRVCAIFLCLFALGTGSETACFEAVIALQFRIRPHRFVPFPSATSSKKHQSVAVYPPGFCSFFVFCVAKFDRPGVSLGRSFSYLEGIGDAVQPRGVFFDIV